MPTWIYALLLPKCLQHNNVGFPTGYDVPKLNRYFDWIAVMTYDYHGHWDKQTGHVAPMYYHPKSIEPRFNAVSSCRSLAPVDYL